MRYVISYLLLTISVIYFILFLFIALIVSYVASPQKYNPWLKGLLRYLFKILRIPVIVENADKINPDKTYLYMANHVSLFDIPLLGGYVPGFTRGIEAARQHRWPLYGWVMSRMGNIPIERNSIHSSVRSIRQTIKNKQTGKSIIILPEGHRTLTGEMKPFKKLPFFLAKQLEVEIIPIGLSGLFHLLAKDSWKLNRGEIKIKFGEPISPKTIKELSTIELRDLVREKIENLIEKP